MRSAGLLRPADWLLQETDLRGIVRLVERRCDSVLLVRQQMTVDVKGDRDRGVTEMLLNSFRMRTPRNEHRCAGVP